MTPIRAIIGGGWFVALGFCAYWVVRAVRRARREHAEFEKFMQELHR